MNARATNTTVRPEPLVLTSQPVSPVSVSQDISAMEPLVSILTSVKSVLITVVQTRHVTIQMVVSSVSVIKAFLVMASFAVTSENALTASTIVIRTQLAQRWSVVSTVHVMRAMKETATHVTI